MRRFADQVDTRAARRLADSIGLSRVVLISLIVVGTALGAMAVSGIADNTTDGAQLISREEG